MSIFNGDQVAIAIRLDRSSSLKSIYGRGRTARQDLTAEDA
ncbi:MAG: hypothetical protein ACK526_07480 [Planctomyces sp.]